MKTLDLTKDACNLIADALYNEILELNARNDEILQEGLNDITQEYINSNTLRIGELKTLWDYIRIDL